MCPWVTWFMLSHPHFHSWIFIHSLSFYVGLYPSFTICSGLHPVFSFYVCALQKKQVRPFYGAMAPNYLTSVMFPFRQHRDKLIIPILILLLMYHCKTIKQVFRVLLMMFLNHLFHEKTKTAWKLKSVIFYVKILLIFRINM